MCPVMRYNIWLSYLHIGLLLYHELLIRQTRLVGLNHLLGRSLQLRSSTLQQTCWLSASIVTVCIPRCNVISIPSKTACASMASIKGYFGSRWARAVRLDLPNLMPLLQCQFYLDVQKQLRWSWFLLLVDVATCYLKVQYDQGRVYGYSLQGMSYFSRDKFLKYKNCQVRYLICRANPVLKDQIVIGFPKLPPDHYFFVEEFQWKFALVCDQRHPNFQALEEITPHPSEIKSSYLPYLSSYCTFE